jgi:hypothetical protein
LLDLFHPFFSKWTHPEKEGYGVSMQRLVECLESIDESSLPDTPDVRLDEVDHPLIYEIIYLATDLLIADDGGPDFDEMDKLFKEHGYFVFPGERDRCGWLTACLQTKKGFIVFG